MRRLRALAVLALGGAVAASAEPFDADYDVFDDALAPSPLVSPEAPSYLDDANAWVDRLRRRAEDIAAARPLVNDAYRGFFEDLAHVRPEHASPWPLLWRNAGASAEDESAKVRRFRFATEEAEGAARESALGRLAAPAAAGDAVLGALEVSEDILARTSPDALDAASDVARVIQEQTELAKAALAAAAKTRDDDYAADFDFDFDTAAASAASAAPVSASFAVDPRGPFASFPDSGPGSFPDAGTIRSIADPGTYGALGTGTGTRSRDGDPKGFGGVRRVRAFGTLGRREARTRTPRGSHVGGPGERAGRAVLRRPERRGHGEGGDGPRQGARRGARLRLGNRRRRFRVAVRRVVRARRRTCRLAARG
jgi:hypothetical protein